MICVFLIPFLIHLPDSDHTSPTRLICSSFFIIVASLWGELSTPDGVELVILNEGSGRSVEGRARGCNNGLFLTFLTLFARLFGLQFLFQEGCNEDEQLVDTVPVLSFVAVCVDNFLRSLVLFQEADDSFQIRSVL